MATFSRLDQAGSRRPATAEPTGRLYRRSSRLRPWRSAFDCDARGPLHPLGLRRGAAGFVTLRLPEEVRAEFEVDVSGDEVEVEVEFTWTLTPPAS